MSWVKHYYSEYFDYLELLESADALRIFTSYEVEPRRECVWSYEFYGETDDEFTLIKEQTGWVTICDCKECKKFGEELFEYYSILMALTAVKDKFPGFQYSLWTTCEKFRDEAEENIFCRYGEIYKCIFLKTLGENLALAMTDVAVTYRSSEIPEGAPF